MSSITRETRRESYDHIESTLGERQKIVFEELHNQFNEGATAKELATQLHAKGLVHSPERNSVHPRLNELITLGFVEVTGKKTCQYTNRKVAIYKSKK